MTHPIKALILACAVGLAGCAPLTPKTGTPQILSLSGATTGTPVSTPVTLELPHGTPLTLFVSKDNRISIKRGDQTTVLDEKARVHGGNTLQLQAHHGAIYASWWSHQDGKTLYLTKSTDDGKTFGPVEMINDEHGVLPPYSLVFGEHDVVGASYMDERVSRFGVFFNRSVDGGTTWPRPDSRLDAPPAGGGQTFAMEPVTVRSGNVWVSTWQDSETIFAGFQVHRVLMRRSTDFGKTWSPATELLRSKQPISALHAAAIGKTIAIVFDDYQTGITALVSNDEGANWLPPSIIDASSNSTNSGIVLALANGNAYVSWIAQEPNEKPTIEFGRIDLGRGTWVGAAKRIDVKTPSNTLSTLPTIYAFEHGPVVLAWGDDRDIRPNIYLSMSSDQGATWSAPAPFGRPGLEDLGLPHLQAWDGRLAMAYEQYPDDNINDGVFKLTALGIGPETKVLPTYADVPVVDAAQKEKLLNERVRRLWTLREAGDYKATYGMFDFAMRNFFPEKDFLEKSGNINYFSFKIKKISIEGNIASVDQEVTYDSKPFMMPNGTKESVKRATVDVKTTWAWIGDNWYIVYAPAFGKPLLTY